MRAACLLFALFAVSALPAAAQRYEMSPAADLELALQSTEPGAMAFHAEKEPVLTAEDFESIEVELSAGAPGGERYNLLLTLTPIGAHRLSRVWRTEQGRSLVLRSRGRTFNALQIAGPHTGRRLVWRVNLPQPMVQAWAQHILVPPVETAAESPAD